VSKGGPSGGAACEGAKRGSMWVSERSEGEGAPQVGPGRARVKGDSLLHMIPLARQHAARGVDLAVK